MCLNQTAVDNHLYKLPKFYFHQKKLSGSLKEWGFLNLNRISFCHQVMPNAKDDGKEASKVPQKLSRHLEECQNVEKVPKTLKCAIFFCQFAHFIPNAQDDGKEASKVPQKRSGHLEECQNIQTNAKNG